MTTDEYTEWRILSKRPGDERFSFISFPGNGGYRSRLRAQAFIDKQVNSTMAGWEFKLQSRQVKITKETTPWK